MAGHFLLSKEPVTSGLEKSKRCPLRLCMLSLRIFSKSDVQRRGAMT